MKITLKQFLLESDAYRMFVVYRAHGPHSDKSYYGYGEGDDPREAFLKGAQRSDQERADVRLLQANRGDVDAIKVDIIDVFDNELDAWMLRNEVRERSADTISGPTMFPGNVAQRAAKEYPDRVKQWMKSDVRNAKTAREAYALGKYTRQQLEALTATHPKKRVVYDLDHLTPQEFEQKYF